jgi:flagellar basal body-associated protein FliL
MWNDKKSVALSKICIMLFIGIVIAAAVTAPWMVGRFLISSGFWRDGAVFSYNYLHGMRSGAYVALEPLPHAAPN